MNKVLSALALFTLLALCAADCTTTIRMGYVYQSSELDVSYTYTHETGRRELQQKYCRGDVEIDSDFVVVPVDFTQTCQYLSACYNATLAYISQRLPNGKLKYNIVALTGSSFPAGNVTIRFAQMFPDIKFIQASRPSPVGNQNIATYVGYVEQARYLEGIVAGLTTVTGKIGYVNVNNQTQTFRQINAFAFGVQKVNPTATIYAMQGNTFGSEIGDRLSAQQLKQRVPTLDLYGFQSLFAEVSRYACEFDMMSVGYGSDISQFVGSSVLTSATWNWGKGVQFFVDQYLNRNFTAGSTYSGTIAEGAVDLAPFSSRVAASTVTTVNQARANVVAGTDRMFCDLPAQGLCAASYMLSLGSAPKTTVNGTCTYPAGTCLNQAQIQGLNIYHPLIVNLGAADLTQAPQYAAAAKVTQCWTPPSFPTQCNAKKCKPKYCRAPAPSSGRGSNDDDDDDDDRRRSLKLRMSINE